MYIIRKNSVLCTWHLAEMQEVTDRNISVRRAQNRVFKYLDMNLVEYVRMSSPARATV
jgi:hypothetical protein